MFFLPASDILQFSMGFMVFIEKKQDSKNLPLLEKLTLFILFFERGTKVATPRRYTLSTAGQFIYDCYIAVVLGTSSNQYKRCTVNQRFLETEDEM